MIKYIIVGFLKYLIFCHEIHSSYQNPLYGPNVRHAQANEFPFVVSIGMKFSNIHVCTGGLISLIHVLTSGHCLDDHEPRLLQVKVGSVDLWKTSVYNVDKCFTYEMWAEKYNVVSFDFNDIAVIKLVERVKEPGIQPAPYVKIDQTDDLIGKHVVTAGWGSTNCCRYTRYLRTATLRVISRENCSKHIYVATNQIDYNLDGVLCTVGVPSAALGCGDSGGPVLLNGVIIGINESSPLDREHEEDHSDECNLHTSVSYYGVFIDDVLRGSV